MKYREVAQKLTLLGFQESERRGGGSHHKWYNPDSQRATVLPDWGSRDLKVGTVRAAIRQLDIDWQDFRNASVSRSGPQRDHRFGH